MAALSALALIISTLAPLAVCSPLLPRAATLPPVIQGSTPVINATLTYPWPIVRDGGGGGTISGKYIINFSDSQTLNEDDLKNFGFYPFVSNTIASTSAVSSFLQTYYWRTRPDFAFGQY
jgi:hypothetical protein